MALFMPLQSALYTLAAQSTVASITQPVRLAGLDYGLFTAGWFDWFSVRKKYCFSL